MRLKGLMISSSVTDKPPIDVKFAQPKVRFTLGDLAHKLSAASGLMKELMGVANNAAWNVCLDAKDQIKTLPNWKQRVKGGKTIEEYFNLVTKEFEDVYEHQLINSVNGFFDLQGMPDDVKNLYGDITNREYYDFWCAIGGSTHNRTRFLVTSLCNKYRLALVHGDIKDAEVKAWGMTGIAVLTAAVNIYEMSLDMIHDEFKIPRKALELNFHLFSLRDVKKRWESAVRAAMPEAIAVELSETDDKNIDIGLTQLYQAWTNGPSIYSDMEKTLKACGDDVMKSRKCVREAIKEVEKLRNAQKNDSKTDS